MSITSVLIYRAKNFTFPHLSGTHPDCETKLVELFKRCTDYQIQLCNASELSEALTKHEYALIAFGGGHVFGLISELLAVDGLIQRIRDAVQRRGFGYLGICAGAIMGCVNFVQYRELRIDREIFLCLGNYIGHGFPFLVPTKLEEDASRVVQILSEGESFASFWNRGPKFVRLDSPTLDTLLPDAYYHGTDMPASLKGMSGRGKVFLLGFHPEIQKDEQNDRYFKKVISHLKATHLVCP